MGVRDRLRQPTKPMHVGLVSRNEIRRGYKSPTPEKYLPILEDKEPVSIIISAYQSKDYIEECLDSIERQTYFIDNDDYEILVGVDACESTLEKLIEIKDKYKNLRVFMMEINKGTYITTNTLFSLAKNENVIRFDSDDIMMPEMVNEIMSYSKEFNFIRFSYIELRGNEKVWQGHYPHGVVFFTKTLLSELGGYKPWRCAADTELMTRGKDLIIEKQINKSLFYRRMHSNSLTKSSKFGARSEIRDKYRDLIGKHKSIKIRKIINKYRIIE